MALLASWKFVATLAGLLAVGPGCEPAQDPADPPGASEDPGPAKVDEAKIRAFAASEARRHVEKRLLAPAASEFRDPDEFRSLPDEYEGYGRLYSVSGEFDATNTSGVPIRSRWEATVGVKGGRLRLARVIVRPRTGDDPVEIYEDPAYRVAQENADRERAEEIAATHRWVASVRDGEEGPAVGWVERADMDRALAVVRKSSRDELVARQIKQGRAVALKPQNVRLLEDGERAARIETFDDRPLWVPKPDLHPYRVVRDPLLDLP